MTNNKGDKTGDKEKQREDKADTMINKKEDKRQKKGDKTDTMTNKKGDKTGDKGRQKGDKSRTPYSKLFRERTEMLHPPAEEGGHQQWQTWETNA